MWRKNKVPVHPPGDERSPDEQEPSSDEKVGPEESDEPSPLRLPAGAGRRLAWLALPLTIVAAVIAGYGHYTDPGPSSVEQIVVVPHGGLNRVTSTLQNAGVLSPTWPSGAFFKFSALVTRGNGPLRAAEFLFPARVSVAHVLAILRHARPVEHHITFVQGWTALRIRQVLQQAPFLHGAVPAIPEGTVLPETISVPLGTPRTAIVDRLQHMMDQRLQDIWEHRDAAALNGLIRTPRDLLVLASLIERETARAEERPIIARVFLNRLQRGMRLQTDPSVIYGLSQGRGTLDRPLVHADLLIPEPYNTYTNAGLPPGPICSPGLNTLDAAAHPGSSQALFFVANGHGGHRFAHSLEEHNANIRAFRAEKEAQRQAEADRRAARQAEDNEPAQDEQTQGEQVHDERAQEEHAQGEYIQGAHTQDEAAPEEPSAHGEKPADPVPAPEQTPDRQ